MRKMLVAALAPLLVPVGHAAAQERVTGQDGVAAKIVGGQPALRAGTAPALTINQLPS